MRLGKRELKWGSRYMPKVIPISNQDWRDSVKRFEDYSFQQNLEYNSRLAKLHNASCEHVRIQADNEIIGVATVRIKMIPFIKVGMAYITGGPLTRHLNSDSAPRLEECINALKGEYVDNRKLTLRFILPLGPSKWVELANERMLRLGFVSSTATRPYRTMVVDIGRPEDEIRGSFDKKWRYYLKQAEKQGLSIERSSTVEAMESFSRLFGAFIEKKGFDVVLDARFYTKLQRILPPDERLEVHFAKRGNEIVAGHVASILGDTSVYLLGLSTDAGLESNASYLLQWSAILSAKGRGMRYYDLGGIDPEGNPGVYHFKKGLKGVDVTAPGPYEAPPDGMKAYCLSLAESCWRSYRKSIGGLFGVGRSANGG